MKLNDVYRGMLSLVGCQVDEAGFVSIPNGKDQMVPFTITKKRVVIPIEGQLKLTDWHNRIAFHPLAENAPVSESQIQERYRLIANHYLDTTVLGLMGSLLELATSPDLHSRLSPIQSEFLSDVKEADNGTYERFKQIIARVPTKSQGRFFVHFYVRRKAKLSGEMFSKATMVSFPFYEELIKAESEPKAHLNGVALRKKDLLALKHLMEYIVPGLSNKDKYSMGSNSRLAPTTDALMRAIGGVYEPVMITWNEMADVFGEEKIPESRVEFLKVFENIDTFAREIRSVPALAGNDVDAEIEATAAQQTAQAQVTPPPPPRQNVAAGPAMTAPVQQQPMQQPVQQPPMQQPPQQMVPGHVNPWAPQPVAAPVVKSQGGVDFVATMMARQQQQMPMQMPGQWMPQQMPGVMPMQMQMPMPGMMPQQMQQAQPWMQPQMPQMQPQMQQQMQPWMQPQVQQMQQAQPWMQPQMPQMQQQMQPQIGQVFQAQAPNGMMMNFVMTAQGPQPVQQQQPQAQASQMLAGYN